MGQSPQKGVEPVTGIADSKAKTLVVTTNSCVIIRLL